MAEMQFTMGGLNNWDSPSAVASISIRMRARHLPREKSHLQEQRARLERWTLPPPKNRCFSKCSLRRVPPTWDISTRVQKVAGFVTGTRVSIPDWRCPPN
eukprot:1148091-Pelagomonas_calceolata.AAC.9